MEQEREVVVHHQQLAIALEALERVQLSIRRADTKAAGLVGFQLSVLTIALGGADAAARIWSSGGETRTVAIMLAATVVLGLASSLVLLGAVIWPRITGVNTGNQFAFPALAALAEPPLARLGTAPADAWELAMQLSRTAKRKYELIRLAMWAMAASTAAIVGWLCVTGTSQ